MDETPKALPTIDEMKQYLSSVLGELGLEDPNELLDLSDDVITRLYLKAMEEPSGSTIHAPRVGGDGEILLEQ